ncbi:transcriptional regulator GcvA [Afifella sp. IM 167]|uniref:transcriptional regulator GcvA n=1 Tax=Afifella sp. IM 167 TaxID=2033586 RepID=UPI001CCC2854|nr:transcriptional regulator GcvA [Afifella sp. IM 167]MBZ8133325.1 LysR family transcriptional regulator [Afifella sp. IM 167]
MASPFPPLNPLRAFEVAARHMSFTLAADELCVTQGAVSRQVKALEDHLGFQLFQRHPRGLALTQSGRIYAAALTDSFEQISQATDELLAARNETSLTIKGYTTFLNRWLLPRLPDFQIRHPNIKVQFVAASGSVNFDREEADIGIRYGKGHWRGLVSEPVFNDRLTPVCSPRLLEGLGRAPVPSDILAFPLLHLRRRQHDWADWLALAGVEGAEEAETLYLEELAIAYECAISGYGFAIGQIEYLAAELAEGRLIAPFETVLERDIGYHLIVPASRAGISKVEAFRAWMRELRARSGPDELSS